MPKTKTKPCVRAKGPRSPKQNGKIKYSFKLEGELNISAYVAQRNVNGYLRRRVANLIGADEPVLELRSEGAVWIVPVILTIPGSGHFGPLGQIVVGAHYGHIIAILLRRSQRPVKKSKKTPTALLRKYF